MTAEIATFNKKLLFQIKKAFDGQTGILGCDKLHIRTC
jgi:hypothetical protein